MWPCLLACYQAIHIWLGMDTHGHALWFLWIIKVGRPANPFPQQASKVLLDCSALLCLAHTHCMWKTCSVFCLKIQDHGEGLPYNVIHMFCDQIIHFVKEGFNHCWEHYFDVLWNCPGKVSRIPLGDNGMFRCSCPCEISCSLICIRMNKSWAQKIEPLNNNLSHLRKHLHKSLNETQNYVTL